MANFSQTLMFEGLGDFSFTVPNADTYMLNGKIQLPRLSEGAGQSAVVCTLKKNASTIQTGIAGADGFGISVACAAGDTIHVVLASAATADQGTNVIKSTVSISNGL